MWARTLGGGHPVGKTRPDLGEVQETLLVPLYGRARDATARRSILNDVRARELVDGIDYDFARFDRIDNGQVRWFDLDLPDTIELRQRFFTQTDRQTMIAGSVLDTDWFDTVNAGPGPHLFVAEAVFVYFPA